MKKPERKSKRNAPKRNTNPRKLRVSIIGAGRMGATLGHALNQLGYPIDLVVTGHAASARRAAKFVKTEAVTTTELGRTKLAQKLLTTNFLLISTPDDVLAAVAGKLAARFRGIPVGKKSRRIALHTSGALSSEVLAPLRTAGFAVGSLHPLVSIPEAKSDPKVFRGAYFCVEGDREAVRLARSIVSELGGESFTVDAKSKALYHAAAVMSAGHVVALFDLAVEMLRDCGLSGRRAQKVLHPLLQSTTANLAISDPAQALTGPFARGDSATAKKHLAALTSARRDAALAVYVLLARHSLQMSKPARRDSKLFAEMAKLLSQK
ncbi:MAG TPA: Rossmann-like and DUF2520 domain-containing protein [Pyrinomonadaceae bacterium]|nr:Rossmann-like and DUF2520 domain-containing protein [Pyrinomonadaceae bacterium]